jgi:transposase-like protein
VSVSLSEQEVHWRSILQSLLSHGLRGVQLIVSDAHAACKPHTRLNEAVAALILGTPSEEVF